MVYRVPYISVKDTGPVAYWRPDPSDRMIPFINVRNDPQFFTFYCTRKPADACADNCNFQTSINSICIALYIIRFLALLIQIHYEIKKHSKLCFQCFECCRISRSFCGRLYLSKSLFWASPYNSRFPNNWLHLRFLFQQQKSFRLFLLSRPHIEAHPEPIRNTDLISHNPGLLFLDCQHLCCLILLRLSPLFLYPYYTPPLHFFALYLYPPWVQLDYIL